MTIKATETTMSRENLRLECLRLAATMPVPPHDVARLAGDLYSFVIGTDRAAPADPTKAAIDRVVK